MPASLLRGLSGLALLSLQITAVWSRLTARDPGGSGIPFSKGQVIGLTDEGEADAVRNVRLLDGVS